ncbi:MAG: ROK family protein [Bacteroidota bacterium]
MASYWGIDLGGTKVEGVVLGAANAEAVKCRIRVPTEKEKGYEHIINQIAKLIDLMAQETGERPERIGIGTPGALDPTDQVMKNSNTTVLNGMPLHRDLEAKLQLPLVMANDANCFALAETRMGAVPAALPNAQVVFGVIMGTGVGGGVVVNQQVLNGRHGIGGEWGHNFLDESGGECYCGRVGCVETILSGPNLERYYTSVSGTQRKLKEIVERHHEGIDAHATATMDRLIHFFGKAMGPIINILDPDAIVLGGGVSNIDLLYEQGVAEVEKYVFNPRMETRFLRPKLGDSAGVFGAAMLVV